jgi:hypothetical protein
LLHSQQLQAILNNRHLMVWSTAQMSEVSRFLTEVEMTKISKILDLPEHYYGDNLKLLFNIFTEISFYWIQFQFNVIMIVVFQKNKYFHNWHNFVFLSAVPK